MDGGGFNTSQSQQNERNKGVLPINSHILLKSAGSNANARFDYNGQSQRLGAVGRLIGTLEKYESKETHWVLQINDYCIEGATPVHIIVQQGQVAGFDDTFCESSTNHMVEVIGLLDDHLDYGRSIKALAVREVTSPFQWIGHLMEVALLYKRWSKSGEETKENADPSKQSVSVKVSSAQSAQDYNNQVESMIRKLGESETWGCKRDQLYAQVPNVPKPKVDTAIQYLLDEGMIYNTLDDDTFKSSDQ